TVMYYTGLDPFTLKPIYTATDYREKQLQRALLQWRRPENRRKIYEAMNYCSEEGVADLRELLGFARTPGTEKNAKNAKKDDTSRTSGRGDGAKNPRRDDRTRGGGRSDSRSSHSYADKGGKSAKGAKNARSSKDFAASKKNHAKGGDNYKKKQR
ncbi:MAG: DUF3362 domain-containing protein, partial [Clostridia bacterium]|nr:DUF3362 domain-containing protein [Clostridia bacterium]